MGCGIIWVEIKWAQISLLLKPLEKIWGESPKLYLKGPEINELVQASLKAATLFQSAGLILSEQSFSSPSALWKQPEINTRKLLALSSKEEDRKHPYLQAQLQFKHETGP